jgi:hypothetical protein
MKRIFLFIFIIVGIVNCLAPPNDKDDYSWLMLDAFGAMQWRAAIRCKPEIFEELLPGNTYEFYKEGIVRRIPYNRNGIKIVLEVLDSDRRASIGISSCVPSETEIFYVQVESNKKEISGGIIIRGGKYAAAGNPLTIKYWEITYRYYILDVQTYELSGYGIYPTNFKITISEL